MLKGVYLCIVFHKSKSVYVYVRIKQMNIFGSNFACLYANM